MPGNLAAEWVGHNLFDFIPDLHEQTKDVDLSKTYKDCFDGLKNTIIMLGTIFLERYGWQ